MTQEKMITVTLGKFPRTSTAAKAEERKAPSEATVLGLTLAPASAIAGAGEYGVVITDIDPSSPAAESGLQTGSVILDVGHHAVNTPAEVRRMVEEARSQSKRRSCCAFKGATQPAARQFRSADQRRQGVQSESHEHFSLRRIFALARLATVGRSE
jgi:S1-C subfamily serine protease